jgi:eukaryotic-like serine/threonine-protein kinase
MMHELLPEDPMLIGPYRLRGRLGAGGMGRVFLGLSAGGRPVAVKVIRAELAMDPEFRARFRREVDVARRVSGLFTAPVIDADLDGPVPWLATAYVKGPSLADAVSSHGPLPAGSVLALAAGLAEALNAIHAAGVVHRDLKPANVLLADDGPRVIDFGISRAIESSALTSTGLVVGSPGFMSPEQAMGREVGPPSDIFSLGAVLAFAATGEGPFGSGSGPALVYRVVHSPADLGHLPAEVRPLVGSCLAKEPGQRPTAGQLLAGAGADFPATGWLPEPVTRGFARTPVPEPVLAGLASGSATHPAEADTEPGLVVTASAATPEPTIASVPPAPSSPPGSRRASHSRWRVAAAVAVVAGILGGSATAGLALTGNEHHAPTAQTGSRAVSQAGQGAAALPSYPPVSYSPAPSASSRAASPAATVTSAPPPAPVYTAPSTPVPATTAPAPTASKTPVPSKSPTQTPSPPPSTTAPASPSPSPSTSGPTGY